MRPYDPRRLQELILYVASKSRRDEHFGRVKLAKLLFYSDFGAFARFGDPITGARYRKDRLGPVPTQELTAALDLEATADIEWRPGLFRRQRVPVPRREPWIGAFEKRELALVDEVLERHWHESASDLSRLSHDYPGWRLAALREEIPYHTVFLSPSKPPNESIEQARQLVRAHGWDYEWS